MNAFDAVVSALAVAAIVLGYRAGLLRSLATIFGYLAAAPLAVALMPGVTELLLGKSALPDRSWIVLALLFVGLGVILSALLRIALGEFVGPDIGLLDRLAGAGLGAARIALAAVVVVVVFDRVIPAGREPPFLSQSRLRPYLSMAGQQGLQSLPPGVEDYLDRIKHEQGI